MVKKMRIIKRTKDAHLDMFFTKPDDNCRCTIENKVSDQGLYCPSIQIRIPVFSRKNASLYPLQYIHWILCLIDICSIYSFFFCMVLLLFFMYLSLFGVGGLAFCCICIKYDIFVSI